MSFILALIGILNFINSMLTSVQVRKRELAVLQSIGMTGKQLKAMLIDEGMCYTGVTILVTLIIGTPLIYGIVAAITAQMWFFTYHFVILPIILCVPVLLVFSVIVPTLCYRNMCRKSIVDRLRVSE